MVGVFQQQSGPRAVEAQWQEPVDAELGGGGEAPRVEDDEVRRRGVDVVDDH